jgi:transcriptional regulator with XRE-family HTH domain
VGRPRAKLANSPLARNLDRLMAKHEVSGSRVEELTGGHVTQPDVSRILTGETEDPGASKVRAIAIALGEKMEAFWADPGNPDRPEPSLEAFRRSEFGRGVTDDDMLDLAGLEHQYVTDASPEAWFYWLQGVRIARAAAKKAKT